MGVHHHIFKRGAVSQWRRRLPAQSTETCILQPPLRSTDPNKALTFARRLTAGSDLRFDEIIHWALMPADVGKDLRHVVTTERARIGSNGAILVTDGGGMQRVAASMT